MMGVIEQVSRFDDELRNSRNERHRVSLAQIADSIRRLQRHGLADERLDPVVAAAGLGAMTTGFPSCGSSRAYWTASSRRASSS